MESSKGMSKGSYPVVETSTAVMMATIASHHVKKGELADAKRFIECLEHLLSYQGPGSVSICVDTLVAMNGFHQAAVAPFVKELGRRLDFNEYWPLTASTFFSAVSIWPSLCLKALRIISTSVEVMQPPMPCTLLRIGNVEQTVVNMKLLNLYAASGCISWDFEARPEVLLGVMGPIELPIDVKRHVVSFL